MKIRHCIRAAAATAACCAFFCAKNTPELQKIPPFIVGTDTITLDKASRLAPGALPPAKRMLRAAIECALLRQADKAPLTARDREFVIDLLHRLSAQAGEAWSQDAAASLYRATRVLRDKVRKLPSGKELASFIDSLFASSVSHADSSIVRQLHANDSLLSTMGSPATRENLENIIADIFCLPPGTARILAEYIVSEDAEKQAAVSASASLKGLALHEPSRARKSAMPDAGALRDKAQDNLKLALSYRSQQSISDSIRRHLPNLTALYKKQLKIHQSLSGTVWVTFVINPDGSVASARIKSTGITEKDFLNPLCAYAERMHFCRIPDKVGPMTFEFPFQFSPEQ